MEAIFTNVRSMPVVLTTRTPPPTYFSSFNRSKKSILLMRLGIHGRTNVPCGILSTFTLQTMIMCTIAKMATRSFPMNGGDGVYSYSTSSQFQREAADGAKEMMRDAIIKNLDIKSLLYGTNTIRIVDLGCSIGSNTLSAMQNVTQAIREKCHNTNPEFQVFFNDHVTSDFKTLFSSLPNDNSYYAAGVPGSFHGRLFPTASIHFAHSSFAINWLSKLPEGLLDENKGRITYVGASDVVVNAFMVQFNDDMKVFLNARAEEIVPGGMMVLVSPFSGFHGLLNFFNKSLIALVSEGMLHESLLDSFNIPNYFPCPEDMTKVVETNGCFSIVRAELIYPKSKLVDEADAKTLLASLRAATEGVFISHFGSKIADEAFRRTILKSHEISLWMKANPERACQLFVVLKRN